MHVCLIRNNYPRNGCRSCRYQLRISWNLHFRDTLCVSINNCPLVLSDFIRHGNYWRPFYPSKLVHNIFVSYLDKLSVHLRIIIYKWLLPDIVGLFRMIYPHLNSIRSHVHKLSQSFISSFYMWSFNHVLHIPDYNYFKSYSHKWLVCVKNSILCWWK